MVNAKDKRVLAAAAELRRRAEKLLKTKMPETGLPQADDEPLQLLHELQVHQIELELQNAELRQARDESESTLAKFTDLYDFAPISYLTLDRDGAVRAANLTAATFLGIERSRLLSCNFGLFVADENHQLFAEFLGKVFASQGQESCEVALTTVSKSSLFVHIEAVVLGAGQECRVAVIDITQRKRAEKLLRQQEERNARLASFPLLNPNPVIESDYSGRITFLNPSAEKVLESLGIDKADGTVFLPTGLGDIFAKRGKQEDFTHYREIAINEKVFGEAVFFSSKFNFIRIYAYDITERKRAEEALNTLNEELEIRVDERTAELRLKDEMLLIQSRQAAMGEMIGNIAHQWRQPLNILGLTIQQLLMYDLGDLTKELVETNVNSSMEIIQHMSKTIDDFKNYFRPDKEKADFKLNEVVAKTLSLVENSFKDLKISIEVIAKNEPSIHGYQNEYAQVILNILNNATDVLMEREIKDPRVTITIYTEDEKAVVSISDNAGGIPEEIIGKIFDPYFTTKGPQLGTGVGLFMSKAIIEKNMNGRLTAQNTAGGAEFRIEV